jgi:hypothetical protein
MKAEKSRLYRSRASFVRSGTSFEKPIRFVAGLTLFRAGCGEGVARRPDPRATGGNVSVVYGGAPLPAGLYQFRVVSYRRGDIPISATEDLRGVFLVP